MTNSTHLALPLIEAAQAQKHVTHNEAIAILDALTHLSVSARNVNTPPASPAEGDRLLVGASPTGAFAGKIMQLAVFLAGARTFLAPRAGWRVYVAAESLLLVHDGAAWIDLGLTFDELQNLSMLGVGSTADAANPLSAKLNAALFTAKTAAESGTGNLRLTLNKESAARTVSQLYQSNFSGRAETGLTGDDNFRIKVSADGSTWRDGVVVDCTTGAVTFPGGGPSNVLTFTTSGTYTPTPGMRFAELILFGGGGGGGSGARQATGAIASGGGGGGGGGVARGRFTASQIGASQSVTIGAGGSGGAAQTTDTTSGNAGGAAGFTSFGVLLRSGGGGAGAGGGLAAGSGGGGGTCTGVNGGASASGATGGAGSFGLGGGGSGAGGVTTTVPDSGSGGGGGPATGAAGSAGGGAIRAPTGGGAGGGMTAANVANAGGAGGNVFYNGSGNNGTGGAAGGNGGAGVTWALGAGPIEQVGTGGGGGGGGGGASRNGAASGAGGAGGGGFAIIIEEF